MLIDIIRNKRNQTFHKKLVKRINRDFSCDIDYTTKVSTKSIFEGKNKAFNNSNVSDSHIGIGTYIGDSCFLKNCKIGRYTSISSNVSVVPFIHPI